MRFISAYALLVFVLISFASAQESPDSQSIEHFLDKLARSIEEGDFDTYESMFHVDAIGVVVTSETEKQTRVIAETLKQNKIDFAEISSGKRRQSIEFKLSSIFQDSSSAVVSGMIHYWSSEGDAEPAHWYGNFEWYLLNRNGWNIVASQQGTSTSEAWNSIE